MPGRMKNMANTSTRTLRLLSLLQNHRYWPGSELAERLGVSPRTLRRDIGRLRELGYPVQAQRGIDGGYQLAAGAALPPLVVDDDEAVAVAVALHTAAAQATPGEAAGGDAAGDAAAGDAAEAAVRALAKITQVMPGRLRRRVEALAAVTESATWNVAGRPNLDPVILTTIALACRDNERVRFDYTAADGTRTGRHVEPLRLVALSGRWYLVGYDLDRQGWRNFRVDRLDGPPRGTGARFRPRELPASDAAAYVRASIGSVPRRYEVEVVIDAPAADVRSRIGRWASVEPVPDGRCRARMTADVLEWPAMALGMVGAGFQVVSPPEMRDLLADWARRFTAAVGTIAS